MQKQTNKKVIERVLFQQQQQTHTNEPSVWRLISNNEKVE